MKALSIVLIFLGFFLTGCQSNPYDQVKIDTIREGIVVANAEVRAGNALLQELIKNRSLTDKAVAQDALDKIKEVHAGLATATTAVEAGNISEGQDELEKATNIIDAVLLLLSPYLEQPASGGVTHHEHSTDCRNISNSTKCPVMAYS